jgi:hypothetical protein
LVTERQKKVIIMSRRNILILALAGLALVAFAVVGTVAVMTLAVQTPRVPSDAALFVVDTDNVVAEDGRKWAWNDDANASASEIDAEAPLSCPTGSTNSASFMAMPGNERNVASWSMWEFLGYGGDQTSILLAPLTPDRMGSGSGQAIHQTGGTFSLGVACTANNNLDVMAAYYRTIIVQPGGAWTVEPLK